MQLKPSDTYQYCSSNEQDGECTESPLVSPSCSSNPCSTVDPPPHKRRCFDEFLADSIMDADQLENFVVKMQQLSLEALLLKIDNLIPLIHEIRGGKVYTGLFVQKILDFHSDSGVWMSEL